MRGGPFDSPSAEALRDKAERASYGEATYTKFLTPAERVYLERIALEFDIDIRLDGGYPGAERRVARLAPKGVASDEGILCAALFAQTGRFSGTLSHRDYLGALLALGISRECVGDIAVGDGGAHIFVVNEMARFIIENLREVGREPVRVSYAENTPISSGDDGMEVKGTVSALRIDSVISAGLNLSRGKSCELIAQKRVSINWRETLKPSAEVCEGDTISIRGMGRIRLKSVGGLTKKGRRAIVMSIYKSK